MCQHQLEEKQKNFLVVYKLTASLVATVCTMPQPCEFIQKQNSLALSARPWIMQVRSALRVQDRRRNCDQTSEMAHP